MSNPISPQEKDYLVKVITEIFIKYDSKTDQKTLNEFTNELIEQRDTLKDKNKILNGVNKAFSTIDSIQSYHQDLINAQQQGKSKLNWLKTTIKTVTNINDVQKIGNIVQEVQAALAQSNNQQLSSLLDENVEVFPETPAANEGVNEQIALQGLLGEIQDNSLLNVISFGQQLEPLINSFNTGNENVIGIAKDCFEGELGDNSELLAKKLVTLGVMVTNEEFPIAALEGVNSSEIAMMVDMGVTIAKVGYKLAQGKMKLNQAMEYIYDRAVADVGVVISAAVQVKSRLIGTAIGATLGSVFGPPGAMIGAVAGAVVGKMAGQAISQPIRIGVQKISQYAKENLSKVLNKAGQELEKAGKQVKKWVENIFK